MPGRLRRDRADSNANPSVDAFRGLSDRYMAETFERFPTRASDAGLHEYNGKLEVPTRALYAKHETFLRQSLEAIEALPEVDFTGDAWLDRRALLAEIRSELWSIERGAHRKNPETWASGALGSVHNLIVRHADDIAPVADAVLARMQKLPDYLDASAELVDKPVPLWTEMAEKSCDGAAGLCDAIAQLVAQANPRKKERALTLSLSAKRAFAAFATRVRKKKSGGAGDYALGTERFEALTRERLGWDLSVGEARALGESLAKRLESELQTEAKRFGKGSARKVLERAQADWKPGEPTLIREYETETYRVREAFRKKNLVSFPPDERLFIRPVPRFLQHHFPTAAYSSPGCYDRDQTGIFWVNDLSLDAKTARQKAAEVRQHFGVDATCAHEAYPGHHLQFCTANRHPSRLRRLFAHSVFYEGWTLWCEQMAVDYGIARAETARLNMLGDALWRAHRIIIDCGLQTGSMTYKDAVRHLVKHVGFTRARAEADVNWYTMSPTVPMSYLLGKMEVLRLKRRKVDEQGWTLKRFNDWALSFGTLPWRWMEHSGL
jgi:uncharacterized protein (DUF885 family)